MANYKRRRPKSQRASCQLCKPWKSGWGNAKELERFSAWRRMQAARYDVTTPP